MKRILHLITAAALLAALAGGCSRFTRQDYETLYVGQPTADVRKTIGSPTKKEGDNWIYVHKKPYYRATIHLEQGKLAAKSWSIEKPPSECTCK